MEAWREKGYELEISEAADRILIQDDFSLVVGTVEFKKYVPLNDIDQVFPFYSLEQAQNHSGKIVEIDKFALKKEHRGKNLDRLLLAVSLYTEINSYHLCIGLIEPKLFIALKKFYRLLIEQVEKECTIKATMLSPLSSM
jgi:hypothetical protein